MERVPIPVSKPEPVIDGWLFLLCFLLTVVYPASVLYGMVMSTGSALLRAHHSTSLMLWGIYSAVSIALAAFSIAAGVRLWMIKPDAVRFANIYLRTFLGTHLGYFAFWYLLTRTHSSLTIARMVEAHVAAPLPFFFVWTSYLEHSKRVKATYGATSALLAVEAKPSV